MLPLWFDGRLVERGDACLAVLTDPTRELVCCTTARVTGGAPRHAAAHRTRLGRDAATLGAGRVDPEALTALWSELSAAAFGPGPNEEGIIRVEAHPGSGDDALLYGVPRPLDNEQPTWRALRSPTVHPGPGPHAGAKLVHFEAYEYARAHSATFGVDESLLFDSQGRLVEGARSSLVVVNAGGRPATPALTLGAVRGIGLSLARDATDGIEVAEIREAELHEAREVIALNAVRGARAIVEYGGKPVGNGRPGEWAARLGELLAKAP